MTNRRCSHPLLSAGFFSLLTCALVSGCGTPKNETYELSRTDNSSLQTSVLANGDTRHALISVTEKKKMLRRSKSTANVVIELQPSRVMCRGRIEVKKSNYEGCNNFSALALYRFSQQGTGLLCNDGQTLRLSPSAFSCHSLTGYLIDDDGQQIKYATRLGEHFPDAPGVTRIQRNAVTRVEADTNALRKAEKYAAKTQRKTKKKRKGGWYLPGYRRKKHSEPVTAAPPPVSVIAKTERAKPASVQPAIPQVAGTGVRSTQPSTDNRTLSIPRPTRPLSPKTPRSDPNRWMLNPDSPSSPIAEDESTPAQLARQSERGLNDNNVNVPAANVPTRTPPPALTKRDAVSQPKPFRFNKNLGQSTAFMVAPGVLATNGHSIQNADAIWVYNHHQERVVQAQVLSQDIDNDLALLSVDIKGEALPLANSQTLRKGNEIMAIGYPSIEHYGRETHSTFGHINALNGIDQQFFQFDAPIANGNTGGPVLNKAGQVVGIVSREAGNQVASTANYAVKADYLLKLLKDTTHHEANATTAASMPNPPLSRELADVIEAADPHIYIIMTSPSR